MPGKVWDQMGGPFWQVFRIVAGGEMAEKLGLRTSS
jgi:hypothetical protein